MRGRRPKPTALHELHGNPSWLNRSELDARAAVEPAAPSAGDLDPPPDLTEAQQEIWRDAVASAPPGILRKIDAGALRVWTVAHDLHRQASAALARSTLLLRPLPGYTPPVPVANPYLAILLRASLLMLRAGEQLGFSPVSRPRLASVAAASAPLPAHASSPSKRGRVSDNDYLSLDDYIASAPPIPQVH